LGDPESKEIIPGDRSGFFDNLNLQIKLILRLMADRRVNPLLKLLPIGALVYLFVPDVAIGPIDDALVLWLGTVLFVELCPPAIVKEHRDKLTSVVEGEWREIDQSKETETEQETSPSD
jgi:hypothetical protein